MKKFGKFLFGTASLATLACGAYYVYKNIINKDSSDDLDEFEDEFEDFDTDEEDIAEPPKKDTREYVSINITSEGSSQNSFEKDEAEEVEEEEIEEDETAVAPDDAE